MRPSSLRTAGVALLLACALGASPRARADVAVAWNAAGGGEIQALATTSPWAPTTPVLTGGADVTLRSAYGRLYALSRADATLREIDPQSGSALRSWTLAAGSEPVDLALATPGLAWISRATSGELLTLDLGTGVSSAATDLSAFADPDGNPDLGMLALHEGRLFVQVRRRDENTFQFVPPAMIAVIDVATGTLIDVDPVAAGTQAIALAGTAPKFKMQIVEATRSLYVGATGHDFDAGGIERIDLDTLQSDGLVIREADGTTGSDLGAFVFTTPSSGYLTFTTDLTLSSHLLRFSLDEGVEGFELAVVLDYFVPRLVHDPPTDTLYFPRGVGKDRGILVFDATTGEQLSAMPTPTGGPPSDLERTCACATASCGAACPVPAAGVPARSLLALALAALALALLARFDRRSHAAQ